VTYLMLQMIGALLVSAAFGAVMLWLGQVLWGRFGAPIRAKSLEYELDEARTDMASQNERIEMLHRQLGKANDKIDTLQRSKRQLTATLDSRNQAIHEVETRLSQIPDAPHPTSRESAEDLRRELRVAVEERDEAQTALRQAEARSERFRTELEVLHGIHERMLDDIERLKGRIRETELEVRTTGESRPPAWVMVQPYGPRDDLQRLEGVDPNLERALNRLGIYHYHQIARFETSDVEWLVEHVEGIPPQMIRDSWIVDASRLSGVPPHN
jgi:predicted flap endonuclease-1-like 5' DNA nuclease